MQAIIRCAVGCAILFALCSNAQATLRCAKGIISEGDFSVEVIQKCGEPANRQRFAPALRNDGYPVYDSATVELWVYGPSHGMFQYLRFIDGRLVQIRSERE